MIHIPPKIISISRLLEVYMTLKIDLMELNSCSHHMTPPPPPVSWFYNLFDKKQTNFKQTSKKALILKKKGRNKQDKHISKLNTYKYRNNIKSRTTLWTQFSDTKIIVSCATEPGRKPSRTFRSSRKYQFMLRTRVFFSFVTLQQKYQVQ
jgi:hypothetical protein